MIFEHAIERRELTDCMLCEDAPCTKACGRMDCAALLRSLWFDNQVGAAYALAEELPCIHCDAACESACLSPSSVPIRALMERLSLSRQSMEQPPANAKADLTSEICGFPLENPFLLSSSVVASSYEMCARAFDMGWAGAAFKTISLFPITEASPRFAATRDVSGVFMGLKNIEQLSENTLEENLQILGRLKREYPTKAIVASIMGRTDNEWTELARAVTEAGADVIELNFSCPHMSGEGLGSDIGQHPELVTRFTAAARRGTDKPILAKMTPNTGSMLPAAIAAVEGGADGLAAINTIKSVLSVNPDTYVSSPSVRGQSAVGGYSGAAVKPIALRFIAEMSASDALKGRHISGMGGVYTWRDALEFLLLGAGSVQITTSVMEFGYRVIDDLKDGLTQYLIEKGFASVSQLIGLARDAVVRAEDLERGTVLFPIIDTHRCVGCGRCYVSCRDGGHNAISFDMTARRPTLNARRCVGCHLCLLVCPARAISPAAKRVKR